MSACCEWITMTAKKECPLLYLYEPLSTMSTMIEYLKNPTGSWHFNYAIRNHYTYLIDHSVIVGYVLIITELCYCIGNFKGGVLLRCFYIFVVVVKLWHHLLVRSVIAFWKVGTRWRSFSTSDRSVMGDSPTPVSKNIQLSQGAVVLLCWSCCHGNITHLTQVSPFFFFPHLLVVFGKHQGYRSLWKP